MKKKKKVVYIFQEIVIVAIGILIAVSISNYKENVDNEKYIEKTLLAIENEIKSSQIEVDSVLNRHLKLYEIIDNEIGNNEQTLSEIITSSGGFQVASIKNVSLRFFISNKAELLEFQIISQLLDIESQTDILSDKIKRLADFVYDNLNERNDEVKIKFYHLLADVIDGEQTLLESYSSLLDDNKGYINKHK
ncbi:MAG: DUF6090 family protein [Flaviramulus sp.]|nr:DUF6090 family protein [Flaviramulus sp.]